MAEKKGFFKDKKGKPSSDNSGGSGMLKENEYSHNKSSDSIVSIHEDSPTTVISSSMVVAGEITSTGDIDVYGQVKGPIKTSGDLKVTGKILGDIVGNNLTLNGCTIRGNILAKGDVIIGTNSIIVGNISADNIKINGKVKGNLNINKMSEFMENALLTGDVRTETISMDQGAKVLGNVNVAHDNNLSDEEFDSILVV